eukprot:6377822-Prymnesium_polylepis.1
MSFSCHCSYEEGSLWLDDALSETVVAAGTSRAAVEQFTAAQQPCPTALARVAASLLGIVRSEAHPVSYTHLTLPTICSV